jgi:hypothetical protein
MAEKPPDRADRAAEERDATAKETAERSGEALQQVSAAVVAGYEEFIARSRDNLEAAVGASNAILDGMKQINTEWLSLTQEQLSEGLNAMRMLARCQTLPEMLEVQTECTRASLERTLSRMARTTDLAAQTVSSTFGPIQASVHKAVEQPPSWAT